MDEKERDVLFLMTIAVLGAVLASGLAAFQQCIIVIPLTIAAFLIMIVTIFVYKHRFSNLAEKVDNGAMIIVLISIIISFVYIYRPV